MINYKSIPGVEVGIRNVIELAVKMLIAFGADFPGPTALLQRMDAVSHGYAKLDDENLWLVGIMEYIRRGVGTTRPWSRLVDANDNISSEVAHVRFDKLMPDWNSVDPAKAVMELSPIRTVFPIHEAATKIGIESSPAEATRTQ